MLVTRGEVTCSGAKFDYASAMATGPCLARKIVCSENVLDCNYNQSG